MTDDEVTFEMLDSNELRHVQMMLNRIDTPSPKPVDVAAIYCAALEREIRSNRRWKRVAAVGAMLAASLLFFALLPKLEVRADANEFTIRWGSPAPIAVVTPPMLPQPDHELHQLAVNQQRELKTLKELLLTLATDVEERDTRQQEKLTAVLQGFRQFERNTQKQFAETDHTQQGLYAAIFSKPQFNGAKP